MAAEPDATEKPEQVVFDPTTALGGEDPLEGLNRSIYHVANSFVRYVYRPVGTGYASVMPRWGVRHVNYFLDNLEFLVRGGSCLLQGRVLDGGIELTRFLTNTTVGIGGFFEVAEDWGLPRQDEDFGQAFASWGIGPGCALYAVGPTNVRDAVGSIFDYAFDPKSYVNGGQAFSFLNRGVESYPHYEQVWRESFDPYWTFRELGLLRRQLQLTNWTAAETDLKPAPPLSEDADESGPERMIEGIRAWRLAGNFWQGAMVDTLRVGLFRVRRNWDSSWAYLSLFNTDFEETGRLRWVAVADPEEDRPDMPYKYWGQDDPTAPLVLVLPGLGGHCSGTTGAALAELFHDRGCAVAVLPNAMNWEFAESAALARAPVPGFVPDDAAAVRRALGKVLADLRENKDISPRTVTLTGVSLGALHTLFVADLERKEPSLGLARYVAINPPVDPLFGMRELDRCWHVGAAWSEEEMEARMTRAAGHFMNMAAVANSPAAAAWTLPLAEDTARFLIGYSFRRNLRELMACLHHRQALPGLPAYVWGDRQTLYHHLNQCSFEWYLREVLLPRYAAEDKLDPDLSIEELNQRASLRAIAATMREHSDIRVLHSCDDFLETPADRAFLQETFGSRIRFFDRGGHLGNLYLPTVQQVILEAAGLD